MQITASRRARLPVITAIVCAIAAAAFFHVNLHGTYRFGSGGADGVDYYDNFSYGWPVAFAEGTKDHSFSGPRHDPFISSSAHMTSTKAAAADFFLASVLCFATGVIVLRLERRIGLRFQFTVADLLSLTAGTAAVLGLVRSESTCKSLSYDRHLYPYSMIREHPWFDQAMVYLAMACAVALTVSTAMNRLGRTQRAKTGSSQCLD
jgi:hypothetical protein